MHITKAAPAATGTAFIYDTGENHMKFGMRKISPLKSFKARTTGRAKRAIKKAVIPGYGKKGMGWLRNPKKAAYNNIYKKTTFSLFDLFK